MHCSGNCSEWRRESQLAAPVAVRGTHQRFLGSIPPTSNISLLYCELRICDGAYRLWNAGICADSVEVPVVKAWKLSG
jgi:hypothetical protein